MKFVKLLEYTKHLTGGKGDDLTRDDVDSDQLEIGVATEMEHTDDEEVAEEIALDHLAEDDIYYDKLIGADLVDEPKAIKIYKKIKKENGGEGK